MVEEEVETVLRTPFQELEIGFRLFSQHYINNSSLTFSDSSATTTSKFGSVAALLNWDQRR